MAGVRKLSSAFSLRNINNKPPVLRVYNLGRLRSTVIRNESLQKYLHFGRYCSLDLLDKKKLYLELVARNLVITENSH